MGLLYQQNSRMYQVWYMPVIQALGSLNQEDWEFQASLGFVVKPHLEEQNRI